MLGGEREQIFIDDDPHRAARVSQHQPIVFSYDQPEVEYVEILSGRGEHYDVARLAAFAVNPQPALWKNAEPLTLRFDPGHDVQQAQSV
jgi:hypothetical protein